MMTAKSFALLSFVALSAVAGAQTWSRAYEDGLAAARQANWGQARIAFQQAIASRPDDRAAATVLPGPATERKLWRDGAPYSPNFLAAYALYRQGLKTADAKEQNELLRQSAGEFETLLGKGQPSNEAFFFLDVIYARLGEDDKRKAVADRLAKLSGRPDFKVDTEVVAPEEIASIQARTSNPDGNLKPAVNGNGVAPVVLPGTPGGGNDALGAVAPLPDKFALVVGQSTTRLPGGTVAYAANDAERMRHALIAYAGYPTDNVVTLTNVSAAQIKSAVDSLAARVPTNGTVMIYFAGAGVNLSGKDYLAGADTESASDTASMIAKSDLFDPFVQRGARIFAFFEASRPIDSTGLYFGAEKATVGAISQVQATRPGTFITPTYRDNKAEGLFTNALVQTFTDLRANRIQIFEFTWQVFSAMRRGSSGTTGGGGTQVCTLPVLTNLAADSKF